MSEEQYYQVEIWDTNNTWKDITAFVKEISECKFQGTGAISVASMVLSAKEGQFIKDDRDGMTPIIEQFTRIRISFSDDENRTKSKVFEVDSVLAQKNVSGDALLPIELKALERALQDTQTTAYYLFWNPQDIVRDLIGRYNFHKGADQPNIVSVSGTNNLLPTTIRIVADFSQGSSYYEAIMHVIQRCGSPVSAGGFGEFFSLTFEDSAAFPPTSNQSFSIDMNIKIQGSGTAPEIENTETTRIHEMNARKEAITGSLVLVAGKSETGHSPVEFHRFLSRREIWHRIPFYDATATYKKDIHVNYQGIRYKALTDLPAGSTPTVGLLWQVVTARDFIGEIDYSPLTKGKANAWLNSLSRPNSTARAVDFDSPAIPDSNLVIRENTFYRDFAHFRSLTDEVADDAALKNYLYNGRNSGLRLGLRILVDTQIGDGTLGGRFAENGGKDRFGNDYADSMCTWDGHEWIVLFSRANMVTDFTKRLYQMAVLYEGKVYEFNAPIMQRSQRPATSFLRGSTTWQAANLKWRAAHDTLGNNDCFHHPTSILQDTGLLGSADDLGTAHYDANSSIKIRFHHAAAFGTAAPQYGWLNGLTGAFVEFQRWVAGFFTQDGDIFGNLTDDETASAVLSRYYDFGWWAAISFPFPTATFFADPEKAGIGSEWGGTSLNNATNFALLDITNANYTRKGDWGFNSPADNELLGPFTGIQFLFKFETKNTAGTLIPFKGNIVFTVAMYDYESNVWKADFTYRHHGDIEQIYIPFSSFTVRRPSHTPYGIRRLFTTIVTPVQEIRNIFEERRVQLITMQLKSAYENDGERYSPNFTVDFLDSFTTFQSDTLAGGRVIMDGWIDALTFVKQPLGTSGQKTTGHVVTPRIVQQPQIRNLEQLDNVAAAERDVHSLQYENYDILTRYRNDLTEEGAITLKEDDIIEDAGRKLVVKYLNYTFGVAGGRPGPLLTISATRRLNPP